MANKRRIWQDVAKGIGILFVVFGHVERGLTTAGILDAHTWRAIDFTIYSFHMPLFMFIAGLSVEHGLARGRSEFLKRKAMSLYYPYILWSIILFVLFTLMTGSVHAAYPLQDFFAIPYKPFDIMWFLYMLFAYCAIVAIVGLDVFAHLALASFVASLLFIPASAFDAGFYLAVYFTLGALFAREGSVTRINARHAAIAIAIFFVGVVVALSFEVSNHDAPFLFVPAMGAIIFILWISSQLESNKALAALGRLSLPIYVMHTIFTGATRIMLQKLLRVDLPAVYLVCCTLAGVLMPIGVFWLLKTLRVQPFFGFDTERLLDWRTGSSRSGEALKPTPLSSPQPRAE